MSCTEGRLGGKNVLSEEALSDKFFHVPVEASVVDDLVFLTIVKGTILSRSRGCRVVLDWLRAPYPRLVFDGTKALGDGDLSEVKCCFTLKAQSGFEERIRNASFLKTGCPRFWLLVWVGVSRYESIFSLSLLRLRE